MNNLTKRLVSLTLILLLLISCFPHIAFADSAVTVESLKLKYPDGKYWNGGDPESYTDKPCTHHGNCSKYGYDGWCGCNTYKNQAIQCMGFAYQLAYLVYGGEPYSWVKNVDETRIADLKAGDVVRYHKHHSIFICAVDGDTVTYADCNWNENCNIRWDNTITKSEILSDGFMYIQSAPYEWGNGEAPCDCSSSYVGEYVCNTESLPLRIRSGHSTDYVTLGWISKGATVYVSKSDGNWAHVTYDGISGYASMEYLKLVKAMPYIEFDKTSLVLGLVKNKTADLNLEFGNIPDDAELDFVYDEELISIVVKGKTITVTSLKEGSASIEVKAINGSGTVANAFANVTVTTCEHSYADACDSSCNDCGFERKAPHNYGEFTSDNNATAENNGTKTRICKDCKHTETVTDEGSMLKDSSKVYTDVKADAWYKTYVDYAINNGIFDGMSEIEFMPDVTMTRAQFVQVLANLSRADTSDRTVTTEFSDVPSGKWYTGSVKWASENGIVSGMGNGLFCPDDRVTREQMCLMLVNYAKYKNITLKQSEEKITFADDSIIADWAKEAVYACQTADLVGGVGDNKFSPKTFATRAQGATIFSEFHKNYIA